MVCYKEWQSSGKCISYNSTWEGALNSLGLTREYVKISKRLTDIYEMSFRNCTSLQAIDYEGTIEEWNNINISSDWCYDSAIETIHCSDGDIQL